MNSDEKFLKLINEAYSSKRSIKDIAVENGIKPSTLGRIKRKYGIKTKRFVHNKRITNQMEQDMIQLYQSGKSSGEIAKIYGYKTRNTVLNVLKKHEIKAKLGNEDYTQYNKDIFNKINSHDKAYILGLLYTDGYVIRDYEGVAIQLTLEDRYILDRIAPLFGLSASVIYINCDTKRKKMPNAKDMARLSVYCPKISEDLKKLGVIREKTCNLSIDAHIPKKYIYSFLRGVIDGDGTLGIAKTGNIWCQISTKSEKFAIGICNLPISDKFVRHSNPVGQWTVRLAGGNKQTIKFLKKMYKNKGNLYLERKYERIKSYIG